jgi:hypothetical protein
MNLGPDVLILRDSIANNRTLCSVNLTDNDVGEEVQSLLFSAFGINKNFERKIYTRRLRPRA